MKTLNIGKEITGIEGNKIMVAETQEFVKVKDILLQYIGSFVAKNGKESIQIFDIGQRIYNAIDYVDLEDAEFELLERSLTPHKHNAIIMSGVEREMMKAKKDED